MPAELRRLRALNTPRPITVEATEDGAPVSVTLSGCRLAVEERLESWRIDDEWWLPRPLSRRYWRAATEDGRTLDLYHDLATGRWFRQAYG